MNFPEPLVPRRAPALVASWLAGVLLGAGVMVAEGATPAVSPIVPFLEAHCYDCHDGTTQKGGLDLESIGEKRTPEEVLAVWVQVHDRVAEGEMPPKKKARPPAAEQQQFLQTLESQLTATSQARQAEQGRVVLRRLNRAEYENTMHDLLGIATPLRGMLPQDGTAHGFDNVGSALDLSPTHLECYLEAADRSLDAAMPRFASFEQKTRRYSYLDDEWLLKQMVGRKGHFIKRDDSIIMQTAEYMPTALTRFGAPVAGSYRFRASVYGYQAEHPVTVAVTVIAPRNAGNEIVAFLDVPPGEQTVTIETTAKLAPGATFMLQPYRFTGPAGKPVYFVNSTGEKNPGVGVHWVEVEGPLGETWPPESHRRLFGELPLVPLPVDKEKAKEKKIPAFEVTSAQPAADAERLLREFVARAFRRPPQESRVAGLVALVQTRLDAGYRFEDALRVGYKSVLTAPEFLFLMEKPGRLDDYALASRLSYFLWSAPPDAALLTLAAQGKLRDPAVLRAQTERLLASPKARSFTDNFCGQWLDLRKIDATQPDGHLYPEYEVSLRAAMLAESQLFFDEVLRADLPVRNFVRADFTLLNGRLAEHYRIPGITGQEFRKVALAPESHRGGILAQAAVLKVTANGTITSPILRGIFVLDRVLGRHPPPPPKDVPPLEPDTRGATTIRQQLEKHRSLEACAGCHAKIDPPGFALESYDVIGGWRTQYRTSKHAHPKVDPSYQMEDGTAFRDIEEFKDLILRDEAQIAHCLAEKLLIYATGAGTQFADRRALSAIVERAKSRQYGLRTLIHEIVQSPVFQTK